MSSHRRTSRSAGHRAPRAPRIRIALSGAAALAVVGGGTAFACMGHPDHHTAQTAWGQPALPADWRPGGHASARPTPPHHSPRPSSPTPSAGASRPAPPPTATSGAGATTKPTTPAPPAPTRTATPAPSPTTTAADTAVQQVLDLINTARAQQGLPAYKVLAGLTASAGRHNQVMQGGCGLSHQCPGESPIGDRETANGVHWSSAGENIGVGGPVADTPQAIADMAVGLTQSMLDEQPPDDGHRRNILSSGFVYIGIAVHRDSSGSVWLTQDFAWLQ
jgi:uncharacterized protein YkwD